MKIPYAEVAVDKEWDKLEKEQCGKIQKFKNKQEVIHEARREGNTQRSSIYVTSKSKNSKEEFHKYKGRVVLRGDVVKDDSGSYAVFTEQRSSASHMTAAIVLDVISRLLGCTGEAVDAVPTFTLIKIADAPK